MRTLLFDFDGTLADSFGVVVDIFYELTNVPRIEDPEVISHLRHLPMMQVAKELHVQPLQIPRLLVKGRQMMTERIQDVNPFAGMPEVLKQLHDEGYTLYVMSSNSAQNVQVFLDEHQLSPYFTHVYGGIGLLNKAAAIRKVLRQSSLQPNECVYIGDESRDVDGAKKAGVHMIAVGWGYNDPALLKTHKPDAIIMKPKELLAEVKEV